MATTVEKAVLGDSANNLNIFSRMHHYYGNNYITDPLVSGYSFVEYALNNVYPFKNTSDAQFGQTEVTAAQKILAAQTININLPASTINKVEVDTFGGQWIAVPGRLDIPKETTAEYWETHNVDVISVLRQWEYRIRDPRTGAAHIYQSGSAPQSPQSAQATPNYFSKNMKGRIFAWLTDPNIERILLAVEFMRSWPTNLPLDAVNMNITTNDRVNLSVTYSYDKFYFYPKTWQEINGQYWQARQAVIQQLLNFSAPSG